MFKHIKLRLRDMATIKTLCLQAECYARESGEDKPGEEHLLLAALQLDEGSALRVFEHLGVDVVQVQSAIKQQYDEALQSVGIDVPKDLLAEDSQQEKIINDDAARVPFDSKPSLKTLMKALYEHRQTEKDIPLLGAHVLEVLAHQRYGVVSRTLKTLNISPEGMLAAAAQEINQYRMR